MITSVPRLITSLESSSTSRIAESPYAGPNGRKPSGMTTVGPPTIVHDKI